MLQEINNPHDKMFYMAMQDLAVARDFFEAHLPAHIKKLVDLDTLKLESSHFVDKKFKEKYVDLLYSARFGERLGVC